MTGDELPDLTFIQLGAIEEWDSEGVPCVIRPGFSSLNGYVRLPEALRDWWKDDDEASVVLDAYMSLNYGPDEDGWVGFDTAHFCDYWAADDLIGLVDDEGMMCAASFARTNQHFPGARRWTRTRLREEVETLAAQVAALAKTVGSIGGDVGEKP
jgi:hypothetical protein